eukprot:5532867-Prymnesium_polylepis.1
MAAMRIPNMASAPGARWRAPRRTAPTPRRIRSLRPCAEAARTPPPDCALRRWGRDPELLRPIAHCGQQQREGGEVGCREAKGGEADVYCEAERVVRRRVVRRRVVRRREVRRSVLRGRCVTSGDRGEGGSEWRWWRGRAA